MVYHKGCKNQCGCILTTEEMNEEKNPSGWCKACKVRHSQEFHNLFDIKEVEDD